MKRNYAIVPLIVTILMTVACAGAAFWIIPKIDPTMDIPDGCDAFGYLRQAKLFAERGFVRGLDTGMNDPAAKLVTELCKNSGTPAGDWYQGVAPHAHHYDLRTDKIILQYPPGTGFFMCLFPEGLRATGCLIIAVELVIAFAWTVAVAARGAILPTAVSAVCGAGILSASLHYGSANASIPLTTGLLAVFCALLGATLLGKDSPPRGRLVLAVACGLIFGALVDVRLPNALIFPGVVICFCSGTGRGRMALSLAAFGLGATVALAPLGWANVINAGGLLHTCYSQIDASPPIFSLSKIIKAAGFYLLETPATVCLVLAVFCIALCWRRCPKAAYGSLVVMAAEFTYFLTHEIIMKHYLFPGICFVIFLCLAAIAQCSKGTTEKHSNRILLFGGLGGVILAFCITASVLQGASRQLPFQLPGPEQVSELKKGVVWADLSGGLFGYYLDIDAPKICWLPNELQYSLIEKIQKKGIRQFFVIDSSSMDAALKEYSARFPLLHAGKIFGKEVYELEPL